MTSSSNTIKAVLFDIGGVVVLSPMIAIAAYEKRQNIPSGYINHAIVRSAPDGAWSKIERGEIPLDDKFYEKFTRDLSNLQIWSQYCRSKGQPEATMPAIDGKFLFWEMMRVSREFDPYLAHAIRRIREMKEPGTRGRRKYVVGALTNDYKFPEDHEYSNDERGRILRSLFDVWVASSEVGMRKPERGVYELAVREISEKRTSWYGGDKTAGVSPNEVVFSDDIGMNLKEAGRVGIQGIRVLLGETWKAVRELEVKLGLPEGSLFEDGVVEKLKREGKWNGTRVASKI
ncbi:HAD-like domain-containing protein [Kalaharituber pfeilii]|nr:HAD-like domain-containing protein [Kalaharituber pfeilii]